MVGVPDLPPPLRGPEPPRVPWTFKYARMRSDRRNLRSMKDKIQDDSDARRLPTVYFLQCPTTVPPAIQRKTTTSMLPLMYAAPPYDYKRRRWASSLGRGVSVSLVWLAFGALWLLSSKRTFRDY